MDNMMILVFVVVFFYNKLYRNIQGLICEKKFVRIWGKYNMMYYSEVN